MIFADGCEGLLFPAFLLNERRAQSSMFRGQSRPEFPSSIVQIDIKALNLSVGDPAYVGPGTHAQGGDERALASFWPQSLLRSFSGRFSLTFFVRRVSYSCDVLAGSEFG